jgi:hypothetical protein
MALQTVAGWCQVLWECMEESCLDGSNGAGGEFGKMLQNFL